MGASDANSRRESAGARVERLFAQEYQPMVRLAFTLVGDAAEAEDIVQDGFVDVARRVDAIEQPGAYLRTAVVSRAYSALRRRRVRQQQPPDPPEAVVGDARELWDVLFKLSEDQRIVVVLRYYEGLEAAEIARIVDLPASTVRSHLRRGLKALRKELES